MKPCPLIISNFLPFRNRTTPLFSYLQIRRRDRLSRQRIEGVTVKLQLNKLHEFQRIRVRRQLEDSFLRNKSTLLYNNDGSCRNGARREENQTCGRHKVIGGKRKSPFPNRYAIRKRGTDVWVTMIRNLTLYGQPSKMIKSDNKGKYMGQILRWTHLGQSMPEYSVVTSTIMSFIVAFCASLKMWHNSCLVVFIYITMNKSFVIIYSIKAFVLYLLYCLVGVPIFVL